MCENGVRHFDLNFVEHSFATLFTQMKTALDRPRERAKFGVMPHSIHTTWLDMDPGF